MLTSITDTSAPTPFHGIGWDRGNSNPHAVVFTLGFNKFRVQSKCCHTNQVFVYKTKLHYTGGVMKKSQLKALATKIHGLAVKSTNEKKPAQNKAAEIKQAHTDI